MIGSILSVCGRVICPLLLACGSSVVEELLEQVGEELDGTEELVDELVEEVVEEVVGAAC